jgi:hypothetical protein
MSRSTPGWFTALIFMATWPILDLPINPSFFLELDSKLNYRYKLSGNLQFLTLGTNIRRGTSGFNLFNVPPHSGHGLPSL